MSLSETSLLREQYVMLATALGVSPVSESLSKRRYLELNNDLLQQILAGGLGGGGGTVDATARAAAAQAQSEIDALEAVNDRLTLPAVTSPSLAPGASHLFTLATGYRTFVLTNIALSAPGRAQGYRTLAVRAADEGRAFGAAPIPDELELDALLIVGALSQQGAGLIGLESDGRLFARLTNTGASSQILTLTLEILPLEAAQEPT